MGGGGGGTGPRPFATLVSSGYLSSNALFLGSLGCRFGLMFVGTSS